MMSVGDPVSVPVEELAAFCIGVLVAAGARGGDARLVTDSLVDADLRGLDSHGVPARLGNYVARLQAGGIRTDAETTTLTDSGALVALDARDGFGQVAAFDAMSLAVARAGAGMPAVVTVCNANHLGALGYWSRMAADRGLIGFALSGAKARITPWGAAQPLLSTNPWSIAFPGDGQRPPVVVDISAGVVLSGALEDAAAAGEPIPPGWALDRSGQPTTDPSAAMAGAMLPFGGAKGGALTLALEILATTLTGGEASRRVPDLGEVASPQRLGQLFVALPIQGLVSDEEFRARLGELLGWIADSPPAAGFGEVRLPGARGEATKAQRTVGGIPLSRPAELERLGDEHGVAVPWRDL